MKDLEAQLSQQEEETKTVITKWQQSCAALEEQNKDLNQKLQETKKGLDEAESKIKEDEDVVAKWQGELCCIGQLLLASSTKRR